MAETLSSTTELDERPYVLEVAGVSVRFGRTQALDDVSVRVRKAEFVALLGPNGAGKSTLIKLLDGVYTPDRGSLTVGAGSTMAVVHQDLGLVDTMTVAENMFLGAPGRRLAQPKAEAFATTEALRVVGLDGVDPYTLVSSLSLAQRAMVAVARVLDRGADVVIVDEVTAGLPIDESRWVVEHLKVATSHGVTVVMVTHKLREITGVASRYVVLRDGRVALDAPGESVTRQDLIDVMSSGTAGRRATRHVRNDVGGEPMCTLRDVVVGRAGPVSLDIVGGAVTGIIGPLGSGLHEVAYVVAGTMQPDSGQVTTRGNLLRSCVPAHRESGGVFPTETVGFNVTAGRWLRWRGRGRLLGLQEMRREAQAEIDGLAVTPPDLDAGIAQLSGGNQQKAVLARALIQRPDLLVLCEPTRGVDIATRQEIYARVREEAEQGTAVFVASTDYEDIAALCDRIASLAADGSVSEWLSEAEFAKVSAEYV